MDYRRDTVPVPPYRFKDNGGSRDTHETDSRTSQTNLKTNPTHRLTRQTTRTPEPRQGNPGTHASPHTTHHTTHPIKRECTGNVLFSTDSRDRLQGRSSVGSPTGQLPRGCLYQVGELVVLSSQRANGDTSLEPLPPFTVRQRRAPQSQHGATPNPTVIRPFTYYGNHDRGFVMGYLI